MTSPPPAPWHPTSWRTFPSRQQPEYPAGVDLNDIAKALKMCPSLVDLEEILLLRRLVARAAKGDNLLLQSGDCAETFAESTPESARQSVKFITKLALETELLTHKPVTRIGRIAGQFAKPRSHAREVHQGKELPIYRGDLINGLPFSPEERTHDPQRMILAYNHAANTLRWCRSCDTSQDSSGLSKTPLFVSHEALVLPYESALTRCSPSGMWWGGSAHLMWIGERTHQWDGGHVEFLRGLINPIGVKLGPHTQPDEALLLCEKLNPTNQPGRLIFITRLGAANVRQMLPPLIEALSNQRRAITWLCDPMHGNDIRLANGRKTRVYDDLEEELLESAKIHQSHESILAGVHLEATSQDVDECTDLKREWVADFSSRNYRSACDPRLNRTQALRLIRAAAGALGSPR